MVNIQVFRDVTLSLGKYSSCKRTLLPHHEREVTLKSFETSGTTQVPKDTA